MPRNETRSRVINAVARPGAAPMAWTLLIVAVALAITVGAALNHRRNTQAAAAIVAAAAASVPATPVPAQIMEQLENVPATAWQQAGTKDAKRPVFVGDSNSVDGKPVVLYVGVGFCPYCAAARWSMVTALSRFGKFTGLTLANSSAVDVYPSSPTFSFYKSSYTSPYVVFESVEQETDVPLASGRYQPLETASPAQEALMKKYDAAPYVDASGAGGIPFILIGGRFMWSGSPFDPGVLAGKSQGAIAATLAQVSGSAAQPILSNANQVTAAICAVDGGKPAEVCSDPVIQSAIKALPNKIP
ncbi:MAG: DUF929 family protein [Gemmatimonadaceae bacterium]